MQKKTYSREYAVHRLTILAVLTSISVVLGIVCKNLFTFQIYYRFTLENLGVIFAGIVYGPVAGAAVGLLEDALSCFFSGGALNPLISLGAAMVGVTAGVVSRFIMREHGIVQYAAAVALAHLVGQVMIKSAAKMFTFGMPWYGIFIGAFMSCLAGAVEFTAIRLLMRNGQIIGLLKKSGVDMS